MRGLVRYLSLVYGKEEDRVKNERSPHIYN